MSPTAITDLSQSFYIKVAPSAIAFLDTTTITEKKGPGLLVTRVSVPRAHRRQGYGTVLVKIICKYADQKGIILYLQALGGSAHDEMTSEQLCQWYRRHGFVGTTKDLMWRAPSRHVNTQSSPSGTNVENGDEYQCK